MQFIINFENYNYVEKSKTAPCLLPSPLLSNTDYEATTINVNVYITQSHANEEASCPPVLFWCMTMDNQLLVTASTRQLFSNFEWILSYQASYSLSDFCLFQEMPLGSWHFRTNMEAFVLAWRHGGRSRRERFWRFIRNFMHHREKCFYFHVKYVENYIVLYLTYVNKTILTFKLLGGFSAIGR